MRKYYWYISAFIRKHGVLVLVSVVIAIVGFSLASPIISKLLDFKKKTFIGVVGRYTLTTLPINIQNEISMGLTKVADDGSASPSIAERWSVEDEGKTYRFLIRKNLHWQDGKEVVPNDLNYNYDRVQIIKNSNEIVFKLPDAYAPFPIVVAQPTLRIVDVPYFIFFKRPKIIGLGKYQVNNYKERNSRISELTISNETEEKVYRFYLTEDDVVSGFERGEVDVITDLSSPGDVKNWPTVNITSHLDKNTVLGVFFNVKDTIFSSKEVRQALNYALPKVNDASRAYGSISPTSWAFANVGKTYDYDEGRAIDRLLSNVPGEPIHFELTTIPLFNTEAEQMKKQWESLGQKAQAACQKDTGMKDKNICNNLQIQVDIRINNFPDVTNFQALLIGQELPIDPDQYALWHSDQETNFTHYQNVRIDSLLEKGRQIIDQKQRAEIYQDFQQFFSDDAPVIFLRFLTKYDVQRKG